MQGRLIYLMGPSGSGKDSLLNAARERLAARGCQIARRVITRSAEAVGEEALAVSLDQFDAQERAGAYAMAWRANGLAYGIPRQIDDWLAAGQDVLVNGSRGYLEVARQRYPHLLPVLLQVDEAVLRQRLLARGRETPEQIEQRLARSRSFTPVGGASAATVAAKAPATGEFLAILDNSGPLENTVAKLLRLLEREQRCA
ncbi:phosphonate metabolism protein/1,5-bisphosphokinase (PRPP-forming) PhnN [Pseudomonas sp. GD03944]|uniref:phosphonate metabolism protein/1,5-bisphosphokinase (PRPP-forming) PhnN n=1 Tax=Pseudomonas sp. GD03944 TaxID=2975409 RepID=UPI00244D14A5|nr:phosphonate metabolism protein/1,5-bisphosphokinase (PRPP-forming) PhnN [Pseudomonas sp. GD03944]MDH1261793.1 phosphonate metabolism protein/1,5-bisphosphokinase (PRPP-forming) PhnN [Pseudomonas sp. GD03944]